MTRAEKQMRQVTRMRSPDGVVHVWYAHDPEYLAPETVCEYIDNKAHWPRQLLEEVDEAPTCVRCIARWT